MGSHPVSPIAVGLLLSAGWLVGNVACVQIIYTSEHTSAFVDVDGPGQAYVVGLGREGEVLRTASLVINLS